MSNSVDELKERHNHSHRNGMLELVLHVHRDVTSKDHKKHAISYTVHKAMNSYLDGPKYRTSRKAMTTYLDGSNTLKPPTQLSHGGCHWVC